MFPELGLAQRKTPAIQPSILIMVGAIHAFVSGDSIAMLFSIGILAIDNMRERACRSEAACEKDKKLFILSSTQEEQDGWMYLGIFLSSWK
jgi:hypothetical protein